MTDTKELDEIIIGRVEPHIYAFSTNTIPNYLKVGDTYRPVTERLNEWKHKFPNLKKEFEESAKVDENVYFRDYSIHEFLEKEKSKIRLLPTVFPNVYYSKEFFKDTKVKDVKDAIQDIKVDYKNKSQKYSFYNAENRLPEVQTYARVENFGPRIGTQDVTIRNFKRAVQNGRTNLLMYAVMRFGKSFTAMCCATEMNARVVVIVSGKADIKNEWKKTVESHQRFVNYVFASSDELNRNNTLITDTLNIGKNIVVFLTLQDLIGNEIKERHKDLFDNNIDLLLVDESHFGARAEKYGEVFKNEKVELESNRTDTEDIVDLEVVNEKVKVFNPKVTIHMSGTPYRILMTDEFEQEDIIAFYQFTDIVDAQNKWNEENLLDDEKKEWENPYFGFPQMIRFAFNPNKSTIKKLEELKKNGYTYAFSELLKPKSIKKDEDNLYKEFKYKQEVLDLFEIIDGSKNEEDLLSFLDYDKIKNGKLCSHIVIVLPYCASCDALEELIKTNKQKFKNLDKYEIINIAGLDCPKQYSKIVDIKRAISNFESEGKKTISLTVNRMLTGCTVPEWDTMIYLKDTSSPQEYDQSIFRLQSQFVKNYVDDKNEKIKINMKPQTLLVDFDPSRMFTMQESKAQIYNVNTDESGNSKLHERLEKELKISPIFTLNKNKITQVFPNNILEAVSNYKKDKGIKEEALAIPVDFDLLNIKDFRQVIELENEIDSKAGLTTPAYGDGNGDDLEDGIDENITEVEQNDISLSNNSAEDVQKLNKDETVSLSKRVQNYYAKILLFAFLTKDKVISLSSILDVIDKQDNKRIASNLGLRKKELQILNNNCDKWVLRKLDYSIQDLNSLSASADINTALKKFGKLGEAIVITPNNICDEMINLLPKESFKKSQKNQSKYLDIAGTSGEFALAIYNRMKKYKFKDNYISNAIYTIPKSSICYELIRKLYEMLNLNIENILTIFTPDIIRIIENSDYNKAIDLLTQNKKFCQIKIKDIIIGEEKMKFDAIVGNPPYQEESKIDNSSNGQNPRTNIFHFFQILALKLSKQNTCFIYPAIRWLHQSGKGKNFKQFSQDLINDKKLDKIIYYANAGEVFDRSGIADGISIVLTDANKQTTGFEYEYNENGKKQLLHCDNPGTDIFVVNPNDLKIAGKIKSFVSRCNLKWLHEGILSRSLFEIESSFTEKNKGKIRVYNSEDQIDFETEVKLLTNDKPGPAGRGQWFVVDKKCIEKNSKYISEWQVVVSSAHAGGQYGRDNQITIIDNHSAFGRSRLALKSFKTQNEAENFFKYAQSSIIKYAFLLSSEALSSLAKYVPDLIDYTNNNKMIDFTKLIDPQLKQLINLTDEDMNYINSKL